MKESIFLIVEQGAPFEAGDFIPLNNSILIAGRKGTNWDPDLSFRNIFVSRKHFAIYYKDHQCYIKDLNSKHGTFLNHRRLNADEETILKASDKISLANDLIKLSVASIVDDTSDIIPIIDGIEKRLSKEFYLDPLKQELSWYNQTWKFSEKEFKCIDFLMKNKDQFVSKEDLIQCVWSERSQNYGGTFDVSNEEINSIIYRIRKKTKLIISIENIRGKGYILSFINEKNSVI